MKTIWTVVSIAGLLAAGPALAEEAHPGHHAAAQADATAAAPKGQRIEIAVTSDGFVPALTKVKVGKPTTLVVTRKVERTCATEIVIKDFKISKPLPFNTPVEVTLTPKKPGKIRFACAMDMIAGELVAE